MTLWAAGLPEGAGVCYHLGNQVNNRKGLFSSLRLENAIDDVSQHSPTSSKPYSQLLCH